MLLVIHSLFSAVVRTSDIRWNPIVAATMLASSLWIAFRAQGGLTGRIVSPILTLLLLIASSVSIRMDAEHTGLMMLFSTPVTIAMLMIVLWVDLTEFHRTHIQDAKGRANLREFLFNHGMRILWYGLLAFIAVYAVAIPLLREWQFQQLPAPENPKFAMDRMSLSQSMLFRACESFAAVCFFVMGTCVGSFLNVVIHRVPKRISVLVKPSHCPGCQQAIKGKDNIPLVGWLKLRATCRNCGISISSRYPVVELVLGIVFLLLYFFELISGGLNLPGRLPNQFAGVLWVLFYTKWDLVGLFLYHCLLLCTVFSWAMIRRDGHQVPTLTVGVMAALMAAPLLIWPHLQPFPGLALKVSGYASKYDLTGVAITSGLGIAAGLCVAGTAHLLGLVASWNLIPRHLPSWILAGLALGWQALVGVLIVMLVWQALCTIHRVFLHDGSFRGSSAAKPQWLVFPGALLVHQCIWRSLVEFVTG